MWQFHQICTDVLIIIMPLQITFSCRCSFLTKICEKSSHERVTESVLKTLDPFPDEVRDEVVVVAPEALLELNGLTSTVRHVLGGHGQPQLSLQV